MASRVKWTRLATLAALAVVAGIVLGSGPANASFLDNEGPAVGPTLVLSGTGNVIVKSTGGAGYCPTGFRGGGYVFVDGRYFAGFTTNSDGSGTQFGSGLTATNTTYAAGSGPHVFQVSCGNDGGTDFTTYSPAAYACDLGTSWSLAPCAGASVTETATVTATATTTASFTAAPVTVSVMPVTAAAGSWSVAPGTLAIRLVLTAALPVLAVLLLYHFTHRSAGAHE